MTDGRDRELEEIVKILHGVGFEPRFDQTHGGCPPQYLGGNLTHLKKVAAKLLARERRAREEAELYGRVTELDELYEGSANRTGQRTAEEIQERFEALLGKDWYKKLHKVSPLNVTASYEQARAALNDGKEVSEND